jgi:SAM-dependent methyltransferase
MTDWFTDERFWERLSHVLFSDERFAAASNETREIAELTGVRSGRALDLCCGPGRHALALASQGFEVTGVDLSDFLLAKAEVRAKDSGQQIDWVRSDMRDFVRPDSYDLVLNLFTSFGYFALPSDNLQTLRNMAECLTDDGCVVIDTLGKEALAERLPLNSQPTEERDGSLLIQRMEVVDDWCRVRSEWLLVRGDQVERFHFEHTLYSGHELRELMNWSGLSRVELYGGLDGRPYGPGARRLVAVGRR